MGIDTVSVCTCNIVHNELYKFDDAVTDEPPRIKSAVSALRCFQLRGRTDYIADIVKKLQYEEDEDMSCPRFLCRAFRSICRIKDYLAPKIENYWGAYLVVGIDLFLAAQSNSYDLPDEFKSSTDQIKISLKKSEDEVDLRNLCNIIDGIKQVVSLSENTYYIWQGAKTMLGLPTIVQIIYELFSNSILTKPDWYNDKQFQSSAFDLVNIWCNLERMYVNKLNELIVDSNKLQEAIKVDSLFNEEVDKLLNNANKLVEVIGDAGAFKDGRFKINQVFDSARYELKNFKDSNEYKNFKNPGSVPM